MVERDHPVCLAGKITQGAPKIDPSARRGGAEASRRDLIEVEMHARDRLFGGGDLIGRHVVKIHPAQGILIREGHRHVEFDLVTLLWRIMVTQAQGFGCASSDRLAWIVEFGLE
jgi:hypothetical protein